MIQFTITDADGEKLKVSAPHSWFELTLKQIIQIEDEDMQKDGLIKLFSIICGIDHLAVANSTDKKLFRLVREVCGFVADPPDWKNLPVPEHLEIGGVNYKVPRSINTMMHGQVEIIAGVEEPLKQMPLVLASVFAPMVYAEVNGKKLYERDQVDELMPVIEKCAGLECYAVGTFFLSKSRNFLNFGAIYSKASQRLKTRKRNYYKNWLTVKGLKGSAP